MKNHNRLMLFSLMVILAVILGACSSGASSNSANAASGSSEMAAPPEGAPAGTPPAGMPEGTPPAGGNVPAAQTTPTAEVATATENATATVEATETPEGTTVAETEVTPAATGEATEEGTAEEQAELNLSAVIEIGNKTYNKTHEDFGSTEDDQSAALVTNGGTLTVGYANVTKSGDSSSLDNSSLFGQNAAILGNAKSTLKVLYSTVKSSGKGAAGVYVRGGITDGTVMDTTIDTTGDDSPALMAAIGATMDASNVTLTTSGQNSGAIATDHGDTAITVENSSASTSGVDSPGIDAAAGGTITISGTKISAGAAPVASIEGASAVTVTDSDLSTSADDQPAISIYQNSGDNETGCKFVMSGGTLTNSGSNGALVSNTNGTGTVELSNVSVTVKSGILAKAQVSESGAEGGDLTLTADGTQLSGNVVVDNSSKVSVELKNGAALDGEINTENSAKSANLTMDASSTWNVTSDSFLTKFADADAISNATISNVNGNGHTVYYNSNANIYLKGKIYTLNGGGYLKPLN